MRGFEKHRSDWVGHSEQMRIQIGNLTFGVRGVVKNTGRAGRGKILKLCGPPEEAGEAGIENVG